MKKLLLYPLLALYSLCTFGQNPKEQTVLLWGTSYSDYPEYLNGKVKEIHQNCYWVKRNGEKGKLLTLKEHQDSSFMQDFHAIFNEQGKLLRFDYLGDNNTIQWSHVNEFKDEKVTRENWVWNDTVKGFSIFHYDEDAHVTDIPMYKTNPEAEYGLLDLKHDSKGNMTQMNAYDDKKQFQGRVDYIWNNENRVAEMLWYTPTDSLTQKSNITYNDHGFFEKVAFNDIKAGKETSWSATYAYDEKGNWTKTIWHKNKRPIFYVERTYTYF